MNDLNTYKTAIVIPYFNAAKHIVSVITKLPEFIHTIYLVDDKSHQQLPLSQL